MSVRVSHASRAPSLVIVLVFVALSWFVFDRVAQRGRFTGDYSSYGSGPEGTRALYLLAQELGVHPVRHAEDLAALPQPAFLVALGGCDTHLERPVSRYEADELERWVSAGGVLLVAGARDYVPSSFGVHLDRTSDSCKPRFTFWPKRTSTHRALPAPAPATRFEEPDAATPDDAGEQAPRDAGVSPDAGARARTIRVTLPSPLPPPSGRGGATRWAIPVADPLRGLAIVPMEQPGLIRVDKAQKYEFLLSALTGTDAQRTLLGVVMSHGRGKVIVLASASMFQNRTLHGSEGGPLFMRLVEHYAPHGPVLFDEFHGGVGERRSVMLYLRQAGVMPALLALLACVGLGLMRAGARFGAVREPRADAPHGTASFVASMGRLYAGAADQDGAIEALVRRSLSQIALHHHVPTASADRLARVLAARGAGVAVEAVKEIIDAQRTAQNERGKLAAAIARIDLARNRALASV